MSGDVMLSEAKDPRIRFQGTTGMLRDAQHDRLTFSVPCWKED